MGSIAPLEPKIIWIKALRRLKSLQEATEKDIFNESLEISITGRKNYFIMDVQSALANVTDFNTFGDLSGIGKCAFGTK